MILLCKTKWYFRVLPYTLALMNVCIVPFWPVLSFKTCILILIGTFVYILLSVLFDGESLAQHLMLTGCELGILLYRTKFIIPNYEEFYNPARDAGWIVFCLIIIGLVSSDRTFDFKEAFEQKFILQKQKDDFEEILNSFPEAVLIVEDH